VDFAIISKPFGRVAVARINIFQGNGEMDQEQIEIVDSPQTELHFRDGFDLI